MDKIQAERMAVAIKEHAGELFRPAGSPVVGNVKGDVPVIEFFDYNCGYCKKAFTDVAKLMDKDKKVRVILKEFPILAKGSEEASTRRARRQDAGQILGVPPGDAGEPGPGQRGLGAAGRREARASTWPGSRRTWPRPRCKKEIDDTRQLATKMGIQGTPHFIVGDRIIPGAPGEPGRAARQARRATCARTAARSAEAARSGARRSRLPLHNSAGPPFRGCGKAGTRGR